MPRMSKRPRRAARRSARSSSSRMVVPTKARKMRLGYAGYYRGKGMVSGGFSHKHVVTMVNTPTYQAFLQTTAAGATQWNVNTQTGASLAFSFSLNGANLYVDGGDCGQIPTPGRQTYRDMYDTYRIDLVEIEMYVGAANITHGEDPAATVMAAFQPVILYAEDSEDANTTPLQEILQFGNLVTVQPVPGKPVKFTIKPAAAAFVGQGPAGAVVATGFTRKFSPDLSINTPDVIHFGAKMNCEMGGTRTVGSAKAVMPVSFKIKYYLTMSDTR